MKIWAEVDNHQKTVSTNCRTILEECSRVKLQRNHSEYITSSKVSGKHCVQRTSLNIIAEFLNVCTEFKKVWFCHGNHCMNSFTVCERIHRAIHKHRLKLSCKETFLNPGKNWGQEKNCSLVRQIQNLHSFWKTYAMSSQRRGGPYYQCSVQRGCISPAELAAFASGKAPSAWLLSAGFRATHASIQSNLFSRLPCMFQQDNLDAHTAAITIAQLYSRRVWVQNSPALQIFHQLKTFQASSENICPSSSTYPGAGLRGQQPKYRSPELPLPSLLLQLIQQANQEM